ncbi:MAG TPA: hypothetical protein VFT74_20080 [Isosphaeraceae bacterium]|nr:hypothetical protein [Isosphaeraceae bacterium]
MSSTTRCPHCRVVLNVPESAGGKRLKCPKCGEKFHAELGPPPSTPGVDTAGPASSLMTTLPRPKPDRGTGHGQADLPTASTDLREAFDLPLLMDEDASPPKSHAPNAASALFGDDPAPRKPTAAETRQTARRCPTCGGVVPQGMSLCQRCGLDLDTGQRVEVNDMYDDDEEEQGGYAPAYQEPSAPVGVWIVGLLSIVASAILGVLALINLGGFGGLSMALVCVLGLVGGVQFLRGRSAKPLLVALMFGAFVNIVGMIVLPVVQANQTAQPIGVQVDENTGEEYPIMPSIKDRIDTQKLTWGVVILIVDAMVMIYVTTSGVRHHFARVRSRADDLSPVGF